VRSRLVVLRKQKAEADANEVVAERVDVVAIVGWWRENHQPIFVFSHLPPQAILALAVMTASRTLRIAAD
jgi:hypothetical protein